MYKIEIEYSTGNTFGTHIATSIIDDVAFADLESAKQALKIIAKHKEMCEAAKGGWRVSDDERKSKLAEIAAQPWSVKSEFSSDYEYQLKVPTSKDCQEWEIIYCFWMGYFETLHEARIVSDEDDGMSISF